VHRREDIASWARILANRARRTLESAAGHAGKGPTQRTPPFPQESKREYTCEDMIAVTRMLSLDESELEFRFIRAAGPGGQNVNKVASAVQLRFDIVHSRSLPPEVRERLLHVADRRITSDGVIVITAQRFRTQARNRADAIERLLVLLRGSARPVKTRVPTRPTRAARERRLERKRRHGEVKRVRGYSGKLEHE